MQKHISILKSQILKFPKLPGCYFMKDKNNKILYIGKAKCLKTRVQAYFISQSHSLKNTLLIQKIKHIDYLITKNEVEAYLLESSLIKKHKPRYNVLLKDDKAYPYIRLSVQDDFPRFYIERQVKDSASIYFGPYTETWIIKTLLNFLNQRFHLRDCSDLQFKTTKRPCLSWDMGFCSAPCVKNISVTEYKKNIKAALTFLKGKYKNVIRKIQSQIKIQSKKLKFEEAAKWRDCLKAVEMLDQKQLVFQKSIKDKDVIVVLSKNLGLLIEILHFRKGRLIGNRFQYFYQTQHKEQVLSFINQYYSENFIPDELLIQSPCSVNSLKLLQNVLSFRKQSFCLVKFVFKNKDLAFINMAKKNAENHFQDEMQKNNQQQDILLEIQKRFKLFKLPERIECYDISHWKGRHSVGSQVVFKMGLAVKQEYRTYNLKSSCEGDDYLALQEVITRRLKHSEQDFPDVILIDGGKGQLRAVQKILKDLKEASPALVSVAKDRVQKSATYAASLHGSGERFYLLGRKNPVLFSANSKALQALLFLRDEAHRVAIESHRKKRDKNFLQGDLDQIKGLGPKRKHILLSKLNSIEDVRNMSEKELLDLVNLPAKLIKEIKNKLSS